MKGFIRHPYPEKSVHLQFQWFGKALGLFGERDKDKSCFRVFIELVKAAKVKGGLTSDELAAHTGLSRGTVVHHLNKLIEIGMARSLRNTYMLRADTLSQLVDELHRDSERSFDTLAKAATQLDASLGL